MNAAWYAESEQSLGCRPAAMDGFLRLARACARILVVGNDLGEVKTPFAFDETTPRTAMDAKANRLPSPRQN